MPAENQNFTIHDLDEFQVRFNVTDAVSTLSSATARAWWGVSSTTSPTSTLVIQRSNAAWTNPGGALSNVNFGSTAVLNIQPTFIDVLVQLKVIDSTQGGSISISPATFPDTFYHECIFSSNDDQTDSVGIATGEITVLQSLFTESNYRK